MESRCRDLDLNVQNFKIVHKAENWDVDLDPHQTSNLKFSVEFKDSFPYNQLRCGKTSVCVSH